jgi:hypothetical protein
MGMNVSSTFQRATAVVGVGEFALGYVLATHGSSLFPTGVQGTARGPSDAVLGIAVLGILWCVTVFGVVGSWVCAGAWTARALPSGRAYGWPWRIARGPVIGLAWILIALGGWVAYDLVFLGRGAAAAVWGMVRGT